jgi:hypothetical protein
MPVGSAAGDSVMLPISLSASGASVIEAFAGSQQDRSAIGFRDGT